MKIKKATINKDGSTRKPGSGRKKGSNSFVKISFGQLKDYIGEKTPMIVSRVWLESLGFVVDRKENDVVIKTQPLEDKQEINFSFTDFNND